MIKSVEKLVLEVSLISSQEIFSFLEYLDQKININLKPEISGLPCKKTSNIESIFMNTICISKDILN